MAAGRDIPVKDLNRNQARYLLAAMAVKRLVEYHEPLSRGEVFSPSDDDQKEVPALVKAGMQKDWQRKFLDKLVEKDLVEKSRGPKYRGLDIETLEKIVIDVRDGEGESLKAIMWPGSVVTAEEMEAGDSEEEDPVEEPEDEDAPVEGLEIVKEVADQLSALVESLHSIAEAYKAQDKKVSQLIEFMGDQQLRSDATLRRMEEMFAAITDERQRKIAEVSTLLADVFARRRSVENQLSSIGRLEEKTLAALNEALEMKNGQGGTGEG